MPEHLRMLDQPDCDVYDSRQSLHSCVAGKPCERSYDDSPASDDAEIIGEAMLNVEWSSYS